MKIWIHKNDDFLRKYLQPDTDVRYIEEEQIRGAGVILIRSDDDLSQMPQAGIIVYYDKDLDSIRQLAQKKLSNNYDYYALNYQLNREQDFDTVVVGSSYALFDLDMELLPSWRNLALGSQDIYYSYHLARKMYEQCPYKRLVWGAHYYTIYSDLSRTKNVKELANITQIYSRIFPHGLGLHNALLIPNVLEEKVVSGIYDIDKSVQLFISDYFKRNGNNYWNAQRTRFSCRCRLWQGDDVTWEEACAEEKVKAAKYRAEMHNKSIRYTQSLEENMSILSEMGKWCLDNGIEFYILNFPVSKLYHEVENRAFKEIYYDVMKVLEFPAVLLDFEDLEFGDECFNDPDHLNDRGARKLTEILVNEIYK
ncbi:hypothetical protein SAMN05216584_11216 [Selenomonas sp. WCT3]|uniref:hypothetical protein n=1 Tax=Selenomonas sp. WCT3 TaxID=3158785 RepID=UPI000880266A|nr:hypothetical protein SAMN05216584_11216 [Selenomonas ruminantium]